MLSLLIKTFVSFVVNDQGLPDTPRLEIRLRKRGESFTIRTESQGMGEFFEGWIAS
ncbi:MAG: hypothetical protein MJE63_27225 [Proteobacteria bacterium]|nr:hypothetical protein [Pseudomonadota bacterium]